MPNGERFRDEPARERQKVSMVGVAQLVRVPDCDSGCRGFESHRPPQFVVVGEGVFLTPFSLGTSGE